MAASTATASPQPSSTSLEQHPWQQALLQVVQDNVATLYRASEDG